MSVLLDLSIFPVGQGASVSEAVAQVIAMIRESGHPYRLTPMSTIIETGEVGEALALVERAHALLAARGCERVYATARLDIRPGLDDRMSGKIEAVRQRIGPVAE